MCCLQEYWLHHNQTEVKFDRDTINGTDQFSEDTRTLWDMGNRLVNYASDVYFMFPSLKANLNATEAWQYVAKNAEGETGPWAPTCGCVILACWAQSWLTFSRHDQVRCQEYILLRCSRICWPMCLCCKQQHICMQAQLECRHREQPLLPSALLPGALCGTTLAAHHVKGNALAADLQVACSLATPGAWTPMWTTRGRS